MKGLWGRHGESDGGIGQKLCCVLQDAVSLHGPLEKAFLPLYTNAPGAMQLSQLSIRWRADSSAVSADLSEACACWQALSSSPYSKAGTPNMEKKIRQLEEREIGTLKMM